MRKGDLCLIADKVLNHENFKSGDLGSNPISVSNSQLGHRTFSSPEYSHL